ncbi:ABC transporter ATP-binding protein [Cohnella zeiphila]|uniref:ABC transporter ATP-binding protein n=1 Tax=Cohnella zeiphila TaxID=2761120 RepID=A0A7X0SLG3_9BACL|nr:ABC transporter ATP-binding protein [Cohnella zeiphila]MBB6732071.1 ABC transporter ATP-binding protein [Cohnella zeiphila]
MPEILTLNGVSRKFQGFELQDVSFHLQPGYIMGLVGPNGSGKTTTIKLIMNMLRRDKGNITVDGIDNIAEESKAKKCIGYVSDENIFVEEWKPIDVAKAMAIYYDTFDKKKFMTFIDRFELPLDKMIKNFSRGMKTRLMLAAALSRETRLLLLDEPTSGLDPAIRAELLDILQDYISDGTRSVLFSTHITTDLEKIADFIAFIYRGKLMFAQNKDDVLADYRIMKGRPSQLSEELKKQFIGLRESQMGFEGLIKTGDSMDAPAETVVEPATLDDIVVYHTMGGKEEA